MHETEVDFEEYLAAHRKSSERRNRKRGKVESDGVEVISSFHFWLEGQSLAPCSVWKWPSAY